MISLFVVYAKIVAIKLPEKGNIMKKSVKIISVITALALSLASLSSCAENKAQTTTSNPVLKTVVPNIEYEIVKDFSVDCIDGSKFTLSEELKDHELVMINLFATWCGPCAMEFPSMEEAWEEYSDKVAIVALSCEKEDTMDVLKDYADEMGLKFPVGREEGTDLDKYATGYPTSLIVDKEGRILARSVGIDPNVSKDTFLNWYDAYTGDNYNPAICTYTVYAYGDEEYEDVVGVVINFCSDTACTPVTTTEDMGKAVFRGTPGKYHIQVVSVPEGWKLAQDEDLYTEPFSESFYIAFSKVK